MKRISHWRIIYYVIHIFRMPYECPIAGSNTKGDYVRHPFHPFYDISNSSVVHVRDSRLLKTIRQHWWRQRRWVKGNYSWISEAEQNPEMRRYCAKVILTGGLGRSWRITAIFGEQRLKVFIGADCALGQIGQRPWAEGIRSHMSAHYFNDFWFWWMNENFIIVLTLADR